MPTVFKPMAASRAPSGMRARLYDQADRANAQAATSTAGSHQSRAPQMSDEAIIDRSRAARSSAALAPYT